MDTITIGDSHFAVEVVGEGEPLLLIHGSIIAEEFVPLFNESALTSRYRVITYHRRGFAGSSQHTGPFSIAQQAADALAVLRATTDGRAHVAGHSYGGATAMQLTLDAPDAVHSLSLLEPALLNVPSGEAFLEAVGPVVATYEQGDVPAAINGFLDAALEDGWRERLHPSVPPDWFENAVACGDTFFQVELPAIGEWTFGEDEAQRIQKPILAVLGGDSGPAFQEGHALIRSWWPDAEPFVLPKATHGLQYMNPHDMAVGLAAFLARHPMGVASAA